MSSRSQTNRIGSLDLATDAPAVTTDSVPVLAAVPSVGRRRSREGGRRVLLGVGADVATLGLANVITAGLTDRGLDFVTLILFDAIAIAAMAGWRAYAPRVRLDVLDDIRLAAASTALAGMAAISFGALTSATIDANDVLVLWLVASGLLSAGRIGRTEVGLRRRRLYGSGAKTLIIGAGNVGRLTARRLMDHPEFGLRPVGFLDREPIDVPGSPLPLPVFGGSEELEASVIKNDVDCVVFTFSSAPHGELLRLLDECDRIGVRALVVPRLFERVPSRLNVEHVGGLPLLEMYASRPRGFQYAVKYVVDRMIGALLLVVLSPILIATALAVRLSLGRPILYRQERVGLDGCAFNMFKFRTMRPILAPDDDVLQFQPEQAPGGVEGSDRRTRIGTFLRATSLDELVQLVNVVKGEMSIVGPRPERPEYVDYFAAHVHRYDDRHRVKGGMTGWAQIHRLRGKTSIQDRVEWDNYYIENFSLWLDLKIILLTIPAILRVRAE